MEKIIFSEYLRHGELNERLKEPVKVEWKNGFGKGTGKFNILDEQYEIEFDEVDTKDITIRGMKFFRIVKNTRVTRYTESKEPFAVTATIKEQVEKYIKIIKPDIFGFMGTLDEPARLRHYQRMLMSLESKYKDYKTSFTTDMGGERIYILSKLSSTEDTLNNLKELQEELGKV